MVSSLEHAEVRPQHYWRQIFEEIGLTWRITRSYTSHGQCTFIESFVALMELGPFELDRSIFTPPDMYVTRP